MQFYKAVWLILFVVLATALAACGGDGEEIALLQSVTAEEEDFGSFTLHYPEGWINEVDNDNIYVATSQTALDRALSSSAEETLSSDEAGAWAWVIAAEEYADQGIEGDSPTEVIQAFVAGFVEGGNEANLGDPDEFSAGGRSATLVSGTIANDAGVFFGAIIVAIAIDGGTGFIFVITPPDEVDDREALARALASEFEFTPAAQ